MKYATILTLGALLTLIGCKPAQTYEWGNYEGALYTLMKDPTSLEKYGRSLQRQILDGEVSGKVPPGIYAEYGYFLAVTNQPGEAIKNYEKEKQRWPESARLMDKMILNSKSPKPKQVTSQSANEPTPATESVAAPVITAISAPTAPIATVPPGEAK